MSTQQTEKRVPLSNEKNPVALGVATAVRYNTLLKQRQGVLSTTKSKVDFFRFKRFVRAVQSPEFQKQQAKHLKYMPPIPNDINAINQIFVLLIQNQLIVPVVKMKTNVAKKQGYQIDKNTPALEVQQKAIIQPDAYYAWNFTPLNPLMPLYSILAVIAVFTIILFPLWPLWMRKGVWYLSTACLCLVGVFFGTAIVRTIIYVITLATMKQQFWLFPNLFADVGVLDSFKPVYEWEDPSKSKKGKKVKKAKKVDETVAKPTVSTTTTAPATAPTNKIEEIKDTNTSAVQSTSTKSTKRREPTIEDVAED